MPLLATDPRARDIATRAFFAPKLFQVDVPRDIDALKALRASGNVLFEHDTLGEQLAELVETRSPDRKLTRQQVSAAVDALWGDASTHGTWAFYPWSGRLVRVLPSLEFEELRTSRNRNKITREEQTRLAALRIGIAGLSVGQSTAVTLALEGIGGLFRLADFDTLSLSNMNRLRAGVHDIGVNKAVLVAREIFEINPYAQVDVFLRGIRDDSIESFFSDSAPLDLLFEECDDLKMKFRLREEARRRGVAVLMETSDRGLFDVERFDLEPQRPLFHSLVGEVNPDHLANMTTYEKVPLVLDIIGAKTMSRRMAASLVDIDATIKTWPQLASAVALGGAINADAARRIALGKFTQSGRFFVDIEAIVSDERAKASHLHCVVREPALAVTVADPALPSLAAHEPIPSASLERIVALGALAPSGGNCQPWRFSYSGGKLRCWHDKERSKTFLDFENRATYLAFGALTENLRLASGMLGIGASFTPFPDPASSSLLCEATFGGAPERLTPEDEALARQIEVRVTNRRLGRRLELPAEDAAALKGLAARAGASLTLVSDPGKLSALGAVLGMGDRLRFMSPVMHAEMMSEIRWTNEEALSRRDGLDLRTLELTPTDEAAMRLISDWSVMAAVHEVRGGHGLASGAKKSIAGACAVGLITWPAPRGGAPSDRERFFRGGIALQRVWLLATKLGLAFQPMTALVYLFARLEQAGTGLDERERSELSDLRVGYRDIFGLRGASSTLSTKASSAGANHVPHEATDDRGVDESPAELMVFRLAFAGAPSARSLRRTVGSMLRIE